MPRVVGQTHKAGGAKGTTRVKTSWDLEAVLARLATRDEPEAEIARRLIERLTARQDVRMWFGSGAKDSSVMMGPADTTAGLLAV